jgi:hypothetical protein
MSCDNKFKNYLTLDRLDFKPATLIVGTFDPEWPGDPANEWFYGRTHDNSFWDVLPRLYGDPSLIHGTPAHWKRFCHSKQIAITDIISGIDDADQDNKEHARALACYADKAFAHHFDDFNYVNIVALLRKHPSIKNVYLTRGVTEAFWRHIWNPVMQYCAQNQIRERKLISPLKEVSYQHELYNTSNPDNVIPKLDDYILMRWQQEWHL